MEYELIEGIKIYKGTTQNLREMHINNIEFLKNKLKNKPNIFNQLEPSTLTAQGILTNINFNEGEIIGMLAKPTGEIKLIGCNYGKIKNDTYKEPVEVKKSNRGRKPNVKTTPKRKSQGSGEYFSSQITFEVHHYPTRIINNNMQSTNIKSSNPTIYKIKLFRNGKFQVPGIKSPSMYELIDPINVIGSYLSENFQAEVKSTDFIAVMRNYKCRLLNENIYIDLDKLEEIINYEKKPIHLEKYINYLLHYMPEKIKAKTLRFVGKTNILNIAEITYNNDRCFSLNIKFYRPMPQNITKKTTVKLLKKGKINFDGGNSEYEIEELYYWLLDLYTRYQDDIFVDRRYIMNTYIMNDILQYIEDDADKSYENLYQN